MWSVLSTADKNVCWDISCFVLHALIRIHVVEGPMINRRPLLLHQAMRFLQDKLIVPKRKALCNQVEVVAKASQSSLGVHLLHLNYK